MKRKIYTTPRERKIDQLIGFGAFPIVNLAVWFISVSWAEQTPESLYPSLLPWVVNAAVLVVTFIFRPQLGVGYLAFIAVASGVVMALGILFLAACLVPMLALGWIPLIGPILGLAGFGLAFIWGLVYFSDQALQWVSHWWSDTDSSPKPPNM